MRIMALDVGDKTIGVAISDELEIGANPITIVQRTGNVKKEVSAVRKLAEEYEVGLIVVGMPLMLNGTVGVQATKVQDFIAEVRRRTRYEVVTWDERLSTAEVERMLIESDQSRAKRKEVIDKLAAAVILQSYLDRKRSMRDAQSDGNHDAE